MRDGYGDRLESAQREAAQKIILDEIKSIQSNQRRMHPYPLKPTKTTDDYIREVESYLHGQSKFDVRRIAGLEGGTESYFRSRQTSNELLLQGFLKGCDLSTIQFYTNNRNYHKDRVDKLKIFQFIESEIHKYRRSIEMTLREDLVAFKNHITEQANSLVSITSAIFDEYLNILQRDISAEFLKIVNDEKYNIYDHETIKVLERLARKESADFLKYRPLFMDFTKVSEFFTTSVEIKKKFVQQNFRFNPLETVTLSSYLELINKNIDRLANFGSEEMKQYKNSEINKAMSMSYMSTNRSKEKHNEHSGLGSVRTNYDSNRGGSVVDMPADDETIFEMGDTTKMAEPYWKLNQIVLTKSVETTHSASDTISDFILLDKDRYVVSCSNDKSVRITNLITGDNRLAIPLANREGTKCLLYHTKGFIVTGGKDGEIKLFDPTVGQSRGILVGHRDTIWKMIEMPGEAFLSCSEDHSVKFWSLDISSCYKTLISPENKPIRSLIRSTESKFFFASHRIWLYNINTDDIEKTFSGHTGFVLSMAYDKKYNRLLSGSEDDTLRFWSVESCQLLKVINCKEPRCMDIWQGEYLVTGHSNMEIKFWDLGLTRLICKKRTKIYVDAIKVTSDGRIVYPEYNTFCILKNPSV